MPSPLDRPYRAPTEVALRGRYILLAIVAHVLLFAALSTNMQWRSETPPPTLAELWVELPDTSQFHPQPEQPKSQPKPELTPPPVKEDPKVADADIALEQARQKAAEAEKLKLAQEEMLRRQAIEKERLEAKEREEAAKRERLVAEEKKRQEIEAQKQREAAERRRQQAQREAAERERIKQEQLARIQGELGASGNSSIGEAGPMGGTGNAHLAYRNRLAGIVKRNIAYTGDTTNNPEAQVYVETDQGGRITVVKLTRSSGNTAWDDAVTRAIWKTGQFPADTNGKRPASKFDFRLRPLD